MVVEDTGVDGGVVGVGLVRVPGAEDDVVEVGERDEVLDQRHVVVGALAEADGAHLRERADGVAFAALGELDAGDERGGDGAEADAEDPELALSGRDGRGRRRGSHMLIIRDLRTFGYVCEAILEYLRSGVNDPVLPNLSIQQLEYLVAATREPTFARAAAAVGVSPSALSQGLAELERRVGVPLFETVGRGRVLADQADEVVRYAERVLAETGELARWVEQRRSGHAGPLRVGMIDVAAVDHFSDALRAFRSERPDLELRLTVAPSSELLEQLGRGALDLVVCVAGADRPDLTVTPLREESLAVYAPPGVRSASPDTWGPWVTFPQGSRTRAIVADALRAAGARFEVIAESHQPEVLAAMVRLGVGWTVLPVVAGRARSRPAGARGQQGARAPHARRLPAHRPRAGAGGRRAARAVDRGARRPPAREGRQRLTSGPRAVTSHLARDLRGSA